MIRSPRTRWSIPLFGAVATAALASLWQAMWPPLYTATARIMVDPTAVGAAEAAAEWIATQAEIIRSDRVARRVAADSAMASGSAGQSVPDHDATADRLLARLTVEPTSGGGVIAVSYAGADPTLAAQVADAFVTEYDRVSQEIQASTAATIKERARAHLTWLRDDLDQARRRLDAVDRADTQTGLTNLAQAVQVARLASTVDWSGLPGESNTEQLSRSLLADRDHAALNGASFERPSSAGALEEVRSDVERAREAFNTALVRLARFEGDGILARPAMIVLNPARQSVRGPTREMGETVGLAAMAGLIAAWILRAVARRIDRRVTDARELARFSGLAVFGVLRNGEARSRRAVRESPRFALAKDGSVAPALP